MIYFLIRVIAHWMVGYLFPCKVCAFYTNIRNKGRHVFKLVNYVETLVFDIYFRGRDRMVVGFITTLSPLTL